MSLELLAILYLRFEHACPVVLRERSPRHWLGNPDVLGITKARYLYEIEIKRSMSDFRANAHKAHIRMRGELLSGEIACPQWPRRYWFLVPCELAKKVQAELPSYAGLLRGPGRNEGQRLYSVVPAPTNRAHLRLTTIECVRLAKCMANQILSNERRLEELKYPSVLTDEPEYTI